MVQDLKDLKALFKLCRSQGISELKLNGIEIKFGDLPIEQGAMQTDLSTEVTSPYSNFPQGELTPDQLLFYSAGGRPEDDPANKEAI